MRPEILFSIVTINWNRKEELKELLDSLKEQDNECFEIIVVDNNSSDDSIQMVRESYPNVNLIPLHNNIGVQGFNEGVKKALGKYSILLDNDTLVERHFISSVKELVNAYPGYMAYALNITDKNGNSQQDYLPGDVSGPLEWYNFIGGGVVFLTKEYLDFVGYDPIYFIYLNETEFSARIRLAGKKILYIPHIRIIHKTSSFARLHEINYYYYVRNSLLFMRTYFKTFLKWNLIIGFIVINIKRSFKQRRISTFFKAIIHAWKILPTFKPKLRLQGQLAKDFSFAWQGNPSFTSIIKRRLWIKSKSSTL